MMRQKIYVGAIVTYKSLLTSILLISQVCMKLMPKRIAIELIVVILASLLAHLSLAVGREAQKADLQMFQPIRLVLPPFKVDNVAPIAQQGGIPVVGH